MSRLRKKEYRCESSEFDDAIYKAKKNIAPRATKSRYIILLNFARK